MANIRYYAEWSTRAGREITEEQARALSRHVRAWQADDGAPERVEAYEQGRLVRVDYYTGSDAEHGRAYPGVLGAVHRVRANSRSFTWSAVQTIDGAGVVKQRALSLEKDGVELLNVQLDGRGLPTVMEKITGMIPIRCTSYSNIAVPMGNTWRGQDLIENESVHRDGLAY